MEQLTAGYMLARAFVEHGRCEPGHFRSSVDVSLGICGLFALIAT